MPKPQAQPGPRPDTRVPETPFEGLLAMGPGTTRAEPPECFHDLGLDRIVQAAVARWPEYELAAIFYAKLAAEDAVRWRQEVLCDLEPIPADA